MIHYTFENDNYTGVPATEVLSLAKQGKVNLI